MTYLSGLSGVFLDIYVNIRISKRAGIDPPRGWLALLVEGRDGSVDRIVFHREGRSPEVKNASQKNRMFFENEVETPIPSLNQNSNFDLYSRSTSVCFSN